MFPRTFLSLLAGLLIALPAVAGQPVADAGGHQFETRYVEVGKSVTLDATGSYGRGCDLAYAWTLVAKPEGSGSGIANPSSAKPTFVPDRAGDYVIDLVVGDAQGTSDPARVTVSAFQCTFCPLPMPGNQCIIDPIPAPCQFPLPAKNAERWMQLTSGLMDRTLPEITLPGTHDSGAYWLDTDRRGPDFNDKGFNAPWYLEVLAFGGLDEDAIKNEVARDVALAHDHTLLQQLQGGIRYLDLRVTIRNGTFYSYHGLLGKPLMTTLLQDVRTFMEQSEQELVVVNVSHLSVGTHETSDKRAFSDDEHRQLMQLLVDQLGPYLYPRNGHSTADLLATPLGQIVNDGPKILLIYSDDYFYHCDKDTNVCHFGPAADDPHFERFWHAGVWEGGYTNTEKLAVQIEGQQNKLTNYLAGGREKGFALFQTLTVSSDIGDTVGTHAIMCRVGQHLPWVHPVFPVTVLATKLALQSFCDEVRTLHELSGKVNRDLPRMLGALFPPVNVGPALILVDFYEESAVVSEAIRLNQVDLSPPHTDASSLPPPNEHDCNTTSVTAKLVAWDGEGGSGVKEIHYWMSGTSEPNTVMTCGSQVDVPIAAKGVTKVHYYGVDRAGNAESLKTLEVSIAPGGDMTGDCRVDRGDLEALMRSIVSGSVPDTADADEDGKFTGRDFKFILCASGANCGR